MLRSVVILAAACITLPALADTVVERPTYHHRERPSVTVKMAERTDSTAGGTAKGGSGYSTEAPNGTVRYQDYAPAPMDQYNGAGPGIGTGSIHNPSPSTVDPKGSGGPGPNTSGGSTEHPSPGGGGGGAVSQKGDE